MLALGILAAPAHADGERIAVFTKNQTNPFFQVVRQGADAAAKSMNARVTHYIPTKPDSIPEQMSQIEDVIVKKADAIVSYRSANGPFQQVDDLVQVKGIGPKTLDKLRPLVTVGKVKKAKSHADVRAPGSG